MKITIKKIMDIRDGLKAKGFVPTIELLLDALTPYCYCRKCDVRLKCLHDDDETHEISLCGNCA